MNTRRSTDAARPRRTGVALLALILGAALLPAIGDRPVGAVPAGPGAAAKPAFALGGAHTCALAPAGTVKCWGDNGDGQLGDNTLVDRKVPTTVTGLTGVIALTAGGAHTCALLNAGTVKCWGDNTDGQVGDDTLVDRKVPTSAAGLTFATALAAGARHTCALLAAGTAKCWGDNADGQVGDGTKTDRPSAVSVTGGVTTFTAVAAGGAHSCGLLANGTVRCWGDNGSGQVGDNTLTDRTAPVAVSGVTIAMSIAAGGAHTCTALADGTARCFGADADGQLGNGTPLAPSKVPVAVTAITNATGVALGGAHTCSTLANGTARCWGDNSAGQIGDNTLTDRPAPVTPTGFGTAPTNAIEIVGGQYHSCARLATGTVKCWGANFIGQIGDGTTTERHLPTAVSGLTGVRDIAAGSDHNCALLAAGTVKCWGDNTHGQLGDNTRTDRRTPVTALSVANAVAITAGQFHTCALLVGGTAKCWGYNIWGQLGNGNIVEQRIAVNVVAAGVPLANVAGISGGWLFTCARMANGTGRCWGLNGSGQLGVAGPNLYIKSPTVVKTTAGNLANIAEIVTGESHACLRLADGTPRCWGYNTFGQVGNNATLNRNQPTALAGLGGVTFTTVTAGGDHSCARIASGSARCWGLNSNGEVGDGSTTNRLVPTAVAGTPANAAAIAAGRFHTCTLTAGGGAACWGDNRFGQLGDNTVIDRTVPTAVSGL